MNPANYQSMVGPPPGPQSSQQQQMIPQQHINVQQLIYQVLQQQEIPPGWQASVSLQKRTKIIYELVSSLRLINRGLEIPRTIHIAVTFEQKTYRESSDEASYDIACGQKLHEVNETRRKNGQNTQQRLQQQMNMSPQQMQMQMQGMVQAQNQGQVQPGFQNPQMQQVMPPSSAHMQQQLSHQPQMVNPHSSLQPVQTQHHPPSHFPHQNGQAVYTPEEQQQINRMAQILAQNTPKEQMELIQNKLRHTTPEARQDFANKHTDPLTQWFRRQATNRYAAQKAQHAAQRNQVAGALGNGLAQQQPRPPLQNPVTQAAGVLPHQSFDSSQMFVRQQEALRSQEAGHVVVPASSQAIAEQQRVTTRGSMQQPVDQVNGARQMQNPPQIFYPPQSAVKLVPNMSMQTQPNNYSVMPNQVPQHNLQGQLNSLNTPGRTPQQDPNMPNLNRALESPNQQAQAANMWPQQRSQPNQQNDPSQINPHLGAQPFSQAERLDAGQQRSRQPMFNMSPAMQQQLENMPQEQRTLFLTQVHRRQQQMMHHRGVQQANTRSQGLADPMLTQEQVSKPGPHFAGTQNGQTMARQTSNIQNGNGSQPPGMVQPSVGQQSLPHQRQQPPQQSNVSLINQQRIAHPAGIALTEEQAQQMDRQKFPAGILNITGAPSTLPKEVKTWGQLKGWVLQNQGTVPQGILSKLRGLQGLHYQGLAKGPQMGPNTPGQAQVQGNPQPRAQTAQMIPSPNNQPPLTSSGTPRISTPNMTHPLPQPTVQEIQAAKARLPDLLKSRTDDQIRLWILRHRHNDMLTAQQGRSGMTPQQQAQLDQPQRLQQQQQQAQQNQFHTPAAAKARFAPQPVTQGQQPQASPRPGPTAKDKHSQPARAGTTVAKSGQLNQKGTKRSSNDDVVEVPNPNLPTSGSKAQSPKTLQVTPQSRPGVVQQNDAQRQRAPVDSQRPMAAFRVASPASGQSRRIGANSGDKTDIGQQRTDDQPRKGNQFPRICAEVAHSTPRGNPIMVDPQSRAKMVQILKEASKIMSRIPSALHIFFSLLADEQVFRELVRLHILVGHQYRDNKFEQLGDHFTMSCGDLDSAAKTLSKYFAWLLNRIQTQKANAQAQGHVQNQKPMQQPQPQPQPQLQPQAPKEKTPALNAANLQQHELALQNVRAADLQRNGSNNGVVLQKHPSNNSSRPPAAPTSTQPPFSFGTQPPHGVPRAYGDRPNEVTQDKLQIPSAKRRKGNQALSAGSTPVLPRGTSTPQASPRVMKNEAMEVQQTAPRSVNIRCTDPDCAMSGEEFATQADLDTHQKQIHPNFLDPLEFCLESMRIGLNLDENGKSKKQSDVAGSDGGRSSEVPPIKKSTSTQGQTMVKHEVTTPMTRAPTQTGPSPAPNLLQVPQIANAKVAPKDSKAVDPKAAQVTPKAPGPIAEDPWANSSISPSVITSVFSGLSGLQSLGPWSKIQHTLTPDSTLSSGNTDKNSPRPSDISENDAVNISLEPDGNSWMPTEWFPNGMASLEALNMDQELAGMDWSVDDAPAPDTAKAGKRKERRDEFAPSTEWLKVYAPDKL